MSANDGNADGASEEGLNTDAAAQSDLWSDGSHRHDDGFLRDRFGNRVNDEGQRVDAEGRRIDTEGNLVNEHGQRVDDRGRPLKKHGHRGLTDAIPRLPPMMGH